MKNSRLERLAPLTGALTAVLILAGAVTGVSLDYLPSADRAVEIYSDNPIRVVIDGYLGLLSAVTLIWFSGSVYSALREREGGTGRLSMVAFGGGVASAMAIGGAYTVKVAAATRAGAAGGLSPIAAVTSYDLYGAILGNLAAFTFAAFIGATAIISLRTAMFPRWSGWASAVLALGLLSPFGYLFVAFAMVWLVGMSISLYRRGAASSISADPAPGTT
jgi:hypothetical protein